MAKLEPLMTIDVDLSFTMIGKGPFAMRLDVPFTGTATSPHWEGERAVVGTDYVDVGDGGISRLYIRGVVGEGADAVTYEAHGRNVGTTPKELFTFQTGSESLAFLNGAIAAAIGQQDGTKLHLEVHQIVED